MSEIKPVFICNMQSVSGSSSSQQPVLIDESVFQHHFQESVKDGNLVHDVTLSYEEQQTLLQKMNEFEQYKDSLSEEDKKELEKNKSSLCDFALQNNGAGKHFKTYDEFQKFYNNLKSRLQKTSDTVTSTQIGTDDLAQILHYTDTTDLISDGKLGSSAQGFGYDCWALSQLNNYAQTKEGAENIKNRIKQNDDGTFTVTFQNPKSQKETKSYTITQEELQKYGVEKESDGKIDYKYYSSGDIDTRVFEIATNKMLSDNGINYENKLPSIGGGEPLKKVLLHRAMGYDGDIITYNKNEDGTISSIKYGLNESGLTSTENKEEEFTSLSDILQKYKNNAGNLVCTTGKELKGKQQKGNEISKQNWYLAGGHVYNIYEVKDTSLTIQNPYLTTFPLSITQDRFDNTNDGYNFKEITYLPSEIKYPCK